MENRITRILYTTAICTTLGLQTVTGKVTEVSNETSLTRGIQNAHDGDTLKLTQNLTSDNSQFTFTKTLTLDLAGHTIGYNRSAGAIITVSRGNLTIIDSDVNKGGKIQNPNIVTENASAVTISEFGFLTIKDGDVEGYNGINLLSGTLNIVNGKIKGHGDGYGHGTDYSNKGYGVYTPTSNTNKAEVNISGGEISGYSHALSIPTNVTYYITGGRFCTDYRYTIYVNGGILNISEDAIVEGGNDTSESVGLLHKTGTSYITGGYFSANKGVKNHFPVHKSSTGSGTLNIQGGYYSDIVTGSAGYYCNDNMEAATKDSYPYVVNSNSITVYNGNNTAQADTIRHDRWATIRNTTPNAMAVVGEELAEWADTMTNVLIEHSDGESKTYTCEKFKLTDLNDFYTPHDFTATDATYTRATTVNYNSLCLPFAVTSDDVSGKIYTFGSYNSGSSTVRMTEQPDGVAAGTPCIVKSDSPGSALTITKSDVSVSGTIDDTGTLKGRYILDSSIGGEGIYKLNATGTAFGYTTKSAKCSPFRSFLDLSSQQAKSSSLNIAWGNEPTGIRSVISVDEAAESAQESAEHFTMGGIKSTAPLHGLNIIKTNGRCIKTAIR